MDKHAPKGSLGVLVGGGPAPGLNGVISAVTIEGRRRGLNVYGIYDGYKWLVKGDEKAFKEHAQELRIRDVSRIHFDGGSIIRSSRTNPVKVENGVENSVRMLVKLNIRYMVTIGGDDTAYGASEIAKAAKGKIKFAHVPKTIDNDLPLPNNLPTFGFQTARHLGTLLVKNLMEDARMTQRWHVVVAMGRHTGHLALGIGKSAGATVVIIPEEFKKEGPISLRHVCDIFEAAILKRRAMGNSHGVLVIAEGIVERLSEEELKKIPGVVLQYDIYDHLMIAEIEFGRLIKNEIERRFKERGESMKLVEINIGYVLRCMDPIPFDQEYTRDLGYSAVNYLLSDKPEHQQNALIVVDNGRMCPVPFDQMIDPKTKKTEVRFVDTKSESYQVARSYMVRLEKRDLEDRDLLKKMADEAKMTEKTFIDRYGYLVQ
ncbi:6-phosphofructokinase [bacterium]|nr:6-phosphofructokinase [bacterium]